MKNKKVKIIMGVIVGIFLFLFIFYPKYFIFAPSFSNNSNLNSANHFKNLNLEAKAVLVFDLVKNEPIFDINPEAQLPLASLTKIMTAVVAQEIAPEDISNLIDAALAQSSNKAASTLASMDKNFIGLMNKKAEELNLNQTYFLNETGLDVSKETAGAFGSANYVVKIIKYALKTNQDLFEATTNNLTINSNPYASTTTLLIASKTGLTDLAGGNLAIVFDAGFNHPIISVVLGSTEEGRFTDTQKLINAIFKYLTTNNQ